MEKGKSTSQREKQEEEPVIKELATLKLPQKTQQQGDILLANMASELDPSAIYKKQKVNEANLEPKPPDLNLHIRKINEAQHESSQDMKILEINSMTTSIPINFMMKKKMLTNQTMSQPKEKPTKKNILNSRDTT